jgi:hypothetical protein
MQNATVVMTFEAPWSNNTSRLVSGCLVDARWAKATVFSQYPQSFQSAISIQRSNPGGHSNEAFLPEPGPSWRKIDVTEQWLDAINFELPDDIRGSLPSGITSLEALIDAPDVNYGVNDLQENYGDPNTLTIVEHVVASVFADALSRIGTWRTFNLTVPVTESMEYMLYNQTADFASQLLLNGEALYPPPDLTTGNYTRFNMTQTITGYAYKAQALTDWLAAAVLLIHLVFALGHTIYTVVTGRSSECWDTLPELLALSQQSRQSTKALKNTSAGICRIQTFKQKARVRPSAEDMEHLEILFDDDKWDETMEKMDPLDTYS